MTRPQVPDQPPERSVPASSTPTRPTPTSFRVTLGVALQRHRLRRGLTQAQLAELANLSLKYVGEIERGEANTTLDAIERLAEVLGWDPTDALDGTREPITEGVRLLLVQQMTDGIMRSQETLKWLAALDPLKQAVPRATDARPRRYGRARSRARPSGPSQADHMPERSPSNSGKRGSGSGAGGRRLLSATVEVSAHRQRGNRLHETKPEETGG